MVFIEWLRELNELIYVKNLGECLTYNKYYLLQFDYCKDVHSTALIHIMMEFYHF